MTIKPKLDCVTLELRSSLAVCRGALLLFCSELLSQLEDVKLQNTPSGCSVTNNYWFDDSILQAYFSSFNDHPTTVSSKTLFIDPSVSEFIKIDCKDDVIKQLQELKFESYKYVLVLATVRVPCPPAGIQLTNTTKAHIGAYCFVTSLTE
ncbi:hypothetical protein J6590_018569 [Homalodisca vitripennis]|nr:hypothetical protein J6590_018569 [Homalodisca vitripennis]